MITGYNTDVRHRGLVFHVQTEDKGLANPCIESLVYVGGQILGRRRAGYQKLLQSGDEAKAAVVELMERQHRTMIAEIRTGKLDSQVEVQIGPFATPGPPAVPAPAAAPAAPAAAPPPGAAPTAGSGPSLDQVILDYLNSEAEQEHLILVMDTLGELRLGDEALLSFYAKKSVSGDAVAGASIAVKLISTAAEPFLLGDGETSHEGKLNLRVQIPELPLATAALIVTATSEVGTAEIKHLI